LRGATVAVCTSLALGALSSANASGPESVIERPLYVKSLAEHLAGDEAVPAGAVIIVGDSIMHNIPDTDRITPGAVNYGIVGDTTAGILHRMALYRSIRLARVVVLEGGVNDLPFGETYDTDIARNYRAAITSIPVDVRVILLGILPVDESTPKARPGWNRRAMIINERIRQVCATFPNCAFDDMRSSLTSADGNLLSEFHIRGDGIHLNEWAYRQVLIPSLRASISGG
jgi:lysophospholipase L1-like esterase